MSRTFGGFIGLEQWPPGPLRTPARPLTYSAGRAVLAAILRHEQPRRLLVPGYICGSVLQAAEAAAVPVAFYRVTDQLLPNPPALEAGDMLLLVDYFGIRTPQVRELVNALQRQAIVDASMAFFSEPVTCSWWFSSARKFFGLPDGAAWAGPVALPPPVAHNPELHADHLLLAHLGDGQAALATYRANNAAIRTAPHAATPLSKHLYERLPWDDARVSRTRNFSVLHDRLGRYNHLQIDTTTIDGPLHYPLHLGRPIDLQPWHAAGIFAPRLWPDVLERAGADEESRKLVTSIVPLPIDQRYTTVDMNELAWRVGKLL